MNPSQPQPNPQSNNPPGGQSYSNGQDPQSAFQQAAQQPAYQLPPQTAAPADQPSAGYPQPQPTVQPPAYPAVDPTYQMYVNHLYEQQGMEPPQEQTPQYPAQPQVPAQGYDQNAAAAPSNYQMAQPAYQNPAQQSQQSIPQLAQPTAEAAAQEMPAHQPIQPPAPSQGATYQLPATENNTSAVHTAQVQSPPANVEKPLSAKKEESKKSSIWRPLLKAGLVGLIIIAIFNSQLIMGQIKFLVSPQADANASILDNTVSKDSTIVIPKINVSVPVVYDVTTFEEAKIQKALQRGVVHYGNTAMPGESGNGVIVGHSSNNWWASGKYKFAFVLLSKLNEDDLFEIHYKKKKYVYRIVEKKIIKPNDLKILNQNTNGNFFTLITCTPPGTSWQRLYVKGEQIEPKPSGGVSKPKASPGVDKGLPGNTPSFWQQIKERIFGND